MRRFLSFLGFAILLAPGLFAAFEEKPFSARSAALGESGVGSSSGVEAFHDNPGALAFAERTGLMCGHTQLYGDAALPTNAFAGVYPTVRRGAFGVFLSQFGSSLYRETEAGASWAKEVGPRAGLGATLKGQEVRMDRYGSLGAFQVDAGIFGRPIPKMEAGVSVKNITQSSLGSTPETPPALLSAGVSVTALAHGPTSLAVVSESGGAVSWRVGQEAWLHPAFALRAGAETKPNRFAFGLGFRIGGVALDYAFMTHPLLPDQHVFSLSYFP